MVQYRAVSDTTEAFVAWLRDHPGSAIISRDRAAVYADGASQGAPHAVQVADRFHLSRNLSEAMQRLFNRYPTELRQVAAEGDRCSVAVMRAASTAATTSATTRDPTTPESDRHEPLLNTAPVQRADATPARTHAEARYQEVKHLQQHGLGQRAIARQLHLHRRTVRRYMLAEAMPTRAVGQQSVSSVTPYLSYLLQRWEEGCAERRQLWREIQDRGYRGSYASVCRALAHLPSRMRRTGTETDAGSRVRPLSARKATWLVLRHTEDLTDAERATREAVCRCCPDAAIAYPLVQRFGVMIRTRQADALDPWLTDAETSEVVELRNFASSLRQDYDAVRAALELPWSNGQTEGQVNRLKQVKRQMYGRAKFDLLRKRVLGAP